MGENRKELRPRTGSVSIKDTPQSTVVNELLAFAFDEFKRSPMSDIKCAMIKFYSATSIATAKKLLWESFSSALPSMNSHRDTAKRSAADADLDDILEAIGNIDSQKEGSKNLHTTFVARNSPPLPSHLPTLPTMDDGTANSIAQIMTRLENIEHHMGLMGGLVGDALQRNPRDPWLGSPDDDVSTAVKQCMQCSSSSYTPQPEELHLESPPRQASYADAARRANADSARPLSQPMRQTDSKQSRPSSQHITQRRPKKAITGTAKHPTLKSGPRRVELFVYRISSEVSEDDVCQFIESKDIKVIESERMSPAGRVAHSYRILIECADPTRPLTDAAFWPEGICCRRFRRRRARDNEQNGD